MIGQRGFWRCWRSATSSAAMAIVACPPFGSRIVPRPANLPSVDATGLWGRIREGDRIGVPAAIASYLFIVALIPILRLMPADIGVVIYRKT